MSASLAAVLAAAVLGAEPEPLGEAEPHPNALVLEPLAVVFAKTIAIEYERRVTTGFSLALAPAVSYGEITTGGSGARGSYVAVGVTLAARLYPWSTAPSGAFVGPFGGLGWASSDAGTTHTEGLGWSVGGLGGYTWVLGKFFVFSLGAGLAWLDLDVSGDGDGRARRGLYPATRLAIGGVF